MVKLTDQAIYNHLSGNRDLNIDLLDPDWWLGGESQAKNIIFILNKYDEIRNELGLNDSEDDLPTNTVVLTALVESGMNGNLDNLNDIARRTLLNYRSGAGPSNAPVRPPPAPRKRKLTSSEAAFERVLRMAQDEEVTRHQFKKRKEEPKVVSEEEKRNTKMFYNHGDHCTVCLEDLFNNDPVCMIYPCGHLFHCNCLKNPLTGEYWLLCPICRGEYTPANLLNNVQEPIVPEEPNNGETSFGKVKKIKQLKKLLSDYKYLKSLSK
jgi:hypothetical protein